jgi:hypothetical protein
MMAAISLEVLLGYPGDHEEGEIQGGGSAGLQGTTVGVFAL